MGPVAFRGLGRRKRMRRRPATAPRTSTKTLSFGSTASAFAFTLERGSDDPRAATQRFGDAVTQPVGRRFKPLKLISNYVCARLDVRMWMSPVRFRTASEWGQANPKDLFIRVLPLVCRSVSYHSATGIEGAMICGSALLQTPIYQVITPRAQKSENRSSCPLRRSVFKVLRLGFAR